MAAALYPVIVTVAAIVIVMLLVGKNEAFSASFDAKTLSLPIVGRLVRDYNAARFASTLAILAAAGLPILKALQAAAENLSNRAMRTDALDALVMVREGAPLVSALAKKRFPGLVSMFARLSEQTGQLPTMLQQRCCTTVYRGTTPGYSTGNDSGAIVDCGDGRGGDVDCAGCAAADYLVESVCEVRVNASHGAKNWLLKM